MVTALLAVLPAALARLPRRRLAFTLEALQPALRCAGVSAAGMAAHCLHCLLRAPVPAPCWVETSR